MSAWFYNAGIGLIFVVWVGGSVAALAHGIQGTWRPENWRWPWFLALGSIGLFCFFVSLVTFRW